MKAVTVNNRKELKKIQKENVGSFISVPSRLKGAIDFPVTIIISSLMKAFKIDKSFLPFIIVIVCVLIAITIVWLNFDSSFGGTYK